MTTIKNYCNLFRSEKSKDENHRVHGENNYNKMLPTIPHIPYVSESESINSSILDQNILSSDEEALSRAGTVESQLCFLDDEKNAKRQSFQKKYNTRLI